MPKGDAEASEEMTEMVVAVKLVRVAVNVVEAAVDEVAAEATSVVAVTSAVVVAISVVALVAVVDAAATEVAVNPAVGLVAGFCGSSRHQDSSSPSL